MQQTFNLINYIDIIDLSLLNFIDYLEVIDESYQLNNDGQLYLNLSSKNKKILSDFIINNINNQLQYGAINIIINTCKPMQNWRQESRGNAIRSYKCKLIDNSIFFDDIKFNQFIDITFKKLSNTKIKTANANYLYMQKYVIKYIESENIDLIDLVSYLKNKLIYLGNVNDNTLNYNNIIITDGNREYNHGLMCRGDIEETIRRNLLEKGIL